MASVLLVTLSDLIGQSRPSAFGEMVSIDLPEMLDRGVVVPSRTPDSTVVVLWNRRSGRVLVATTDTFRFVWSFRPLAGVPVFSNLQVADVDQDGSSDLFFIDRVSRTIRIATHWLSVDSLSRFMTIGTPVAPTRVLIRDVNGDRFPDLLVFDENEPGMHLILNREGRRWQVGRTIAPELPVRDAAITYLNNDEIPDLITFDWVRSEFHTLYGVGNGRFLDQGLYRSASGADQIILAEPRPDEPIRFMAVQRAPGEIAYWTMDERGDLALRHRVVTDGVIQAAFLLATNGGGEVNLASLLPSGVLRVHHFESSREHVEIVESGLPERTAWAFALPIVGTEESDVLTLVPEQLTALLLRSGRRMVSWSDSLWFSVGVRPEGVTVKDLDGNGSMDIVVANRRSSNLSIIWGPDSLWRPAQVQVEVPRDVAAVSARAATAGVVRFVATHPQSKTISANDLAMSDHSVESTELPVPGIPEWAEERTAINSSRSLSSINQTTSGAMSISVFEPIRTETYLERGLSLSPPATLLGATFEDIDRDSVADLIMVFKPDDTTNISIGIAYGDSLFSMRRRTHFQEFPLTSAQRAYVWTADLNADSVLDIVVVFPRSAQTIYTLLGGEDTSFALPMAVDTAIRIESRSRFRVADVDGDGYPDLLAHVARRGGVGWWRNDGAGSWSVWKTLVRVRDVGGIDVADLNGDGHPDLILTRPEWGVVAIYDGPAAILRELPMEEP